jgi:dipeptidase E
MGGLSWEDEERRRLEDYFLSFARRDRPKVLFVPTAAADGAEQTLLIYQQLADRADVSHLPFFPWPPSDLRDLALGQDVIYVCGGNTANALAIWRVHGFDAVLREAWEAGVVLTGWSAGMLCWFEAGVTDSFGPQLEGMQDGLGFSPAARARTTTARPSGAPSTSGSSARASRPAWPPTTASRCASAAPSSWRSSPPARARAPTASPPAARSRSSPACSGRTGSVPQRSYVISPVSIRRRSPWSSTSSAPDRVIPIAVPVAPSTETRRPRRKSRAPRSWKTASSPASRQAP